MVRAFLLLPLILAAASGAALVSAAPTTGVLVGRVGEGKRPGAFANIVLPALRRGAQTDAVGEYRIPDLPPGRYEVRIQLPGVSPETTMVEIRAGRTTRLDVTLESTLGPDVGDIGPAFPDDSVRKRLRKASALELFRIENSQRHRGDSTFHAKPPWSNTHRLLARARPPSDPWRKRLRKVLESPDSFRAYPPGVMKVCAGGFDPGVVLRFTDSRGVSDVLLCFKCDELKVITDGVSGPIVDFGPNARTFLDLALLAFPGDPGLTARVRQVED